MNNLDIREEARDAGIKLWQIAEKLGISDSNFSRQLRHELSEEEKNRISDIIHKLKGGVYA